MGKVIVQIKVENAFDLENARLGRIKSSEVRSVELDALVDTGSEFLCLAPDVIQKLGLTPRGEATIVTANERSKAKKFSNAWISVLGRDCPGIVLEVNNPKYKALLGYLVLEELHLIVDPKSQKVVYNPEDANEMVIDVI